MLTLVLTAAGIAAAMLGIGAIFHLYGLRRD